MNDKFIGKAKKLLAGFVAAATAITMMPQIPVFAATGNTTYSYDGYDVEYSVYNEWDNGQTVQIKVTNTGEDSILNWAFKYDAEGEINNLWNATVYDQQGEDYIIKNSGWNYEIAPGQSVNFGYTLVNDEFTTPDSFTSCSKRVEKTSGYEVDLNVVDRWNTGIKAELAITNTSDQPLEAWTVSFDSNFTINNLWDGRLLESADNHYTVASEMWTNPIAPGDSKKIGFTALIESDNTPELLTKSLTCVIIDEEDVVNGDAEINWDDTTDTDGDGLPDVYEKNVYGTDINNPDTDGDGLPDGYEVRTLRTNPASKDSDDNGTADGDENFDTDNLTNYEEYLFGTDPYKADTDSDGWTDGDEVDIYNTDPLKYDTDGDGVIDSDEFLLGLDPNDSDDGVTTIRQTISEEELDVNRYNGDFKISIDFEASNSVKRFVESGISRYSGILSDNRSIIGHPISIEYSAGEVKGGTITFRMDDEFVENNSHFYPELGLGMERYGVFYYAEEIGTIVPVPCTYDEENYSIIVDAKAMGDLLIIDYESLMYDLGIESDEILYDSPVAAAFSVDDVAYNMDGSPFEYENASNEDGDYERLSLEEIESILNLSEDEGISLFSSSPRKAPSKSSGNRQVDLVLVVDTTGSMGSHIYEIKRNLSNLISKLRKDGISLYVSVVDYRDITCCSDCQTKVNDNIGRDFCSAESDISKIIYSLYPNCGGDDPETAIDGLGAAYNLSYRESSAKYAFLITDAANKNNNNYGITDMEDVANRLKLKNITTSVIASPNFYSDYNDLAVITVGELINLYGYFCDDMYRIISSSTPAANVVLANNIVSGFFKEPLVKGGDCDTDGDTLSDSDEIDWDYVKEVHKDGTYELYTWKELCSKTSFLWFGTAYTDGKSNRLFDTMCDIEVIPATSNPFSADTDKDYYPDNVEVNEKSLDVLASNAMFINDEGIYDANFHNGSPISTPIEKKNTDGVFEKYFETHDDGNQQARARYSFTRRPIEYTYFSLTPKSRSFYLFKASKGTIDIKISYKGFLWATNYVNPEDDGTYLLEGGKEYTIEIYNHDYSEYQFTVEQDNWVYAKYGAVCTAHESASMFDSSDYKSIYISDKSLHQIINNYCMAIYDDKSITYEDFVGRTDNGKKDETNPFYKNCIRNVGYLNEAQVYGDAMSDSVNSIVGSVASITGVFLLIPVSTAASAVVTVIGGAGAGYSIQSSLFNAQVECKKQEFIDAMYDGKFNFHIYNLSTTTTFMEYHRSEIKSFLPWNTNYYVRKIYANTVYNVNLLTVTTLRELEDGTWKVIP